MRERFAWEATLRAKKVYKVHQLKLFFAEEKQPIGELQNQFLPSKLFDDYMAEM